MDEHKFQLGDVIISNLYTDLEKPMVILELNLKSKYYVAVMVQKDYGIVNSFIPFDCDNLYKCIGHSSDIINLYAKFKEQLAYETNCTLGLK